MINAHRTGAYISRLRKAKDWTQLVLAEKLHVTHQAVSRWEKGDSFPDVGVLPQLAQLFGISIEDLLNGPPVDRTGRVSEGTLAGELSQRNLHEAARLVQTNPDGIDALVKAASLARPSQVDEVVSNLSGFSFTPQQAASLAPYISQEMLQSILDKNTTGQIDGETLVELGPFIGSEALDRLARHAAEDTLNFDELAELAPFVSPKALHELVYRLVDKDELTRDHLEALAPFLEVEVLEDLIRRMPARRLPVKHVIEVAPFVGQSMLDQLIDRLEDPGVLSEYLHELAPFLSKSSLAQAVSQIENSLSAQDLLDLIPFLDQKTLEDVLHRKIKSI